MLKKINDALYYVAYMNFIRIRSVFVLLFFVFAVLGVGAVDYTWDGGAASGDWQDQVNWYNDTTTTNDSGFPGAGDTATFGNFTVTLTNIPAVVIGTVTINNASAAITLGANLSAITVTITNGELVTNGNNLTVSGNLTGGGTLTGGAGTINVDGDLTINTVTASSATTFVGGNYDVTTLTHNSGIFDFDTTGGATIAASAQSFNTVYVSANKTMTEGLTAALLSIDDGITLTTGANALNVTGNAVDTGTTGTLVMGNVNCDFDGDFTINTVTASSATTYVGGNYDVGTLTPNGGLIVFDTTAGSTVIGEVFNNVQISANTTMSGAWTTATLTIDALSTLITQDNSVGAAAVVCNGTLEASAQTGVSTVTLSGDLSGTGVFNAGAGTVDVDGTFIVGTYSATSVTTYAGGNYDVTSLTHNSGIFDFDTTGAATIAANAQSFNTVYVSANKTMTEGLTAALLSIDDGITLTTGANALNVTGNAVDTGTTGTLVMGAVNCDIGGDLTINTVTASSATTYVGGNYDVGTLTPNGGLIVFDTTAGSTAIGEVFNNVQISANTTMSGAWTTATLTIDALSTLTTQDNSVGAAAVVCNGTLEASAQTGVSTVTLSGDLSGTGVFNAGAGTVDVDGTFIVGTYSATSVTTYAGGNYDVTTLTHNGGTFDFDTTGAATIAANAQSFNTVYVSANKTMTEGLTAALLSIDDGITLTTGANALNVTGNAVDTGTTGTLVMGAVNCDIGGDLKINTVTASSATTYVGGNYDVTSLTHNSGIFDFDTTGAATIAANAQTFNTVYVSANKTMTEGLTAALLSIDDGITLTTGANALNVTGNAVDTGTTGTLVMGNVNCDFDGDFTINTVTASSATTYVGGNYDVGTLTPNGGLIVFDTTVGSTVIGEVFNNVQISANTTMSGAWTTATLTIDALSTLITQDNSVGAAAVVCDGTLEAALQTGASTVTVSGNLSGAGTFNAGAGTVDVDGTFIVGTYSATSATTYAGGNYDVTTLTHNGGTFDFDTTGAATIAANAQSFNTVYVSANKTMTEGLTAALLSIDDGITLTTGANALNVTGNAVDTGTTGTLVMGAVNCDIGGDLTINTVTASSATTFVGGNYDVGTLTPNGGLIVFDTTAGSTVIGEVFNNVQISANTTMSGAWTTATLTIDALSTLITQDNSVGAAAVVCDGTLEAALQTGASTVTVSGNLSGAGTFNAGAGTVDVDGTFIVGTYSATSATTYAGGNYDVTTLTHNGGTFDFDTTGAATIAANAQSFNTVYVSANKTMTEGLTAALLSIDDGITLTTGANALNVTGNAVDTGTTGTLVMGAVNCDIGGDLTINTVTASSATTFVGGNYDVGTLTPNGGLIVFDTTVGSTVIGEVFNNVQISANTTMSGAWTTATLTIDALSTLTTQDNSVGAAAVVCNGTLEASAQTGVSTVTLSGDLSGTGVFNAGAGTVDVDGTFIVGTYSATSVTTYAGGNYDVTTLTHNGGTFDFDTTGAATIAANAQSFNTVYVSANKTMTEGLTAALLSIDDGITLTTGANALNVTGNAVDTGTTGTLVMGAVNCDIGGDLTINTVTASSATTYVGGNYDVGTLTPNGGLIVFDTTAGSTAIGEVFNNVQISANTTMSGAWTTATLTIDALSTLTTQDNSVGAAAVVCNGTLEASAQTGVSTVTLSGDLSGTGVFNAGAGTVDVDGTFIVGTYSATSVTTYAGGNYDVTSLTHNSGIFDFDTTGAATIAANAQSFNTVYVSANKTMTEGLTAALLSIDDGITLTTGANALNVTGNAVDTGTTGTLVMGAVNCDIGGDLKINTVTASSATTYVGGNYDVTSLTHNSGIFDFDTTGGATIAASAQSFNTVYVSANKTMTEGLTAALLSIDDGITLTTGANALNVTGNAVDTGTTGTLVMGAVNCDIGGDLTINTVTASSATTYVGGNYDVGTLTPNGGLIVFDTTAGSTVIGEVFNNVQISANTTMSGAWTTATLTIDALITLTTQDNSVGATAVVCDGTLEAALQTGASTVTVSGNLSGAGTFNAGAGTVDVDGTFIVGTYSATSATTYAGGNYDVTSLTHNSGIFDFDTTGAATIAANARASIRCMCQRTKR